MKSIKWRDSWKWLLGLYTAAGFVETIFWGQMTAFTPLYLAELGLNKLNIPLWTGLIAALTSAVGIPFLPFWGALADRYSRQPIIIRSYLAYMVAGIFAVLAGNVWVFVIGRAVMSLSLGNSGLMMTTLAERTPTNRHGLAFAIMNSAGPVGVFLGPLMGGPVVDRLGFRTLLALNVAMMTIVVLLLWLGYRDRYRGRTRTPVLRMAGESVRVAFQTPRLRLMFTALFFLYSGWMLALSYLPLTVTALYTGNAPGTAIGNVLVGGGLLALVLGPLFGSLADRYGKWPVLIAGAGVEAVLWVAPFFTTKLLPFGIAWAVISGIATGVFAVSFSALSDSAAPEIRGRVMSFAYLPVNLGFMLGPAIGSLVTRISLFSIFPCAALLTLIGFGLLQYAGRQIPIEEPSAA